MTCSDVFPRDIVVTAVGHVMQACWYAGLSIVRPLLTSLLYLAGGATRPQKMIRRLPIPYLEVTSGIPGVMGIPGVCECVSNPAREQHPVAPVYPLC